MAKRKLTRAQRLKDRRYRANLADSELTPELLAKRRLNKRLNAPFVEGSPLSYRDVAHERDAAVQLRYGDVQNQLAQRGTNIGNWFTAYQNQLAAAKQASAAEYQGAVTGVQARAQQSQQAAGQMIGQVQQAAQADAAQRGATYDPGVSQGAALAQAARDALAQGFVNTIAAQGQAYGTHFGARSGVGAAAQLQERLRLQGDTEALGKDVGAYKTDYLADRREQERRAVLENKAFGLSEYKAAADVADDVRRSEDKRRGRIVSRKNKRETIAAAERRAEQARREKRAAAREKHVGEVREKSGKALGRLHDIIGRWDTYKSHTNTKTKIVTDASGKQTEQVVLDKKGNPVKVRPSPDQIKAQLIKDKFTSEEIHLALMIRAKKPFTAADVKAAHRLGIRVPRELRPRKPSTQGTNDARPADPKYGRG